MVGSRDRNLCFTLGGGAERGGAERGGGINRDKEHKKSSLSS